MYTTHWTAKVTVDGETWGVRSRPTTKTAAQWRKDLRATLQMEYGTDADIRITNVRELIQG